MVGTKPYIEHLYTEQDLLETIISDCDQWKSLELNQPFEGENWNDG